MLLNIRNISYLVSNVDHIQRDCDMLIENGRIVSIGHKLKVPSGAEAIDAEGCAVIPGLINPHTHLYQNFLKGVSPGLPLVPWCNQVLFPTVGALTEQFQQGNNRSAYLWSACAAIEMIKGGITCCLEMDHINEESFYAWQDIGLRGVVGYVLANQWIPEELIGDEEKTRAKAVAFIEKWHQPDGLVQVCLSPSTVFLCDDNLLLWAGEQAEKHDLGIQIHVSEIASEVQDTLSNRGMTPVELLDDLGLLSPRLSAVHCVHVSESDIERLGNSGTHVVHCPKSNMKLADGIAPVIKMKETGIRLSVGTDGCASNDLLDMWEEMRAAVFLARVATNNANALSARDGCRMATIEAAGGCRMEAGELLPGRLADLAIVELKGTHLRPCHADRRLEMLVCCARGGDVRDTIINGEMC
ncbi:MAG: amidohydrolase, partial [Anaerolineaceae bacterium]|nr:amidohydrolase [Anaerolineaceae bacterium]